MFDNVYLKDRIVLSASIPLAVCEHAYGLLEYLNNIRKATPQWYYAVLIYSGLARDKSKYITMRNGDRFLLTKETLHTLIGLAGSGNMHLDRYKGVTLTRRGGTVSFTISKHRVSVDESSVSATISEFRDHSHKELDVRGGTVIDVGGYMGETALLYAMSGARRVYSFEPVRHLYAVMRRNIKLNRLGGRITPVMALLVGKRSKYNSPNSFELPGAGAARMVSLDDFARRAKIKDGVMKLDCEGGEYEIIRDASSETLGRFKSLHVEYHYGYKDILKRLRSEGFKVKYTKPRLSVVGKFSGIKYMGDLYAVRDS